MNRFAAFLGFALILPLPLFAATSEALSDAANQAFVAANAAKPGVVTKADGVQYRVMTSGFGKRPTPGDTVQIVYNGKLIDGRMFDGTSPGLPVTVSVNALIRGLGEALQMMHAGERWQIVIPSNLGFGPNGAANGAIPPNQTLVFDVTLIAVLAAAAPSGNSSGVGFGVTASSRGTEEQGRAVLSFPQ